MTYKPSNGEYDLLDSEVRGRHLSLLHIAVVHHAVALMSCLATFLPHPLIWPQFQLRRD